MGRERGQRLTPGSSLEQGLWSVRWKGGQPLDPNDGGADGPSPRIAVRLPLWLRERLEDAATRRGTTPSDVVRQALATHLGDEGAT